MLCEEKGVNAMTDLWLYLMIRYWEVFGDTLDSFIWTVVIGMIEGPRQPDEKEFATPFWEAAKQPGALCRTTCSA